MAGMTIVSRESAEKPYLQLAKDIKRFEEYDHLRMAKPESKTDPLYTWFARDSTKGANST